MNIFILFVFFMLYLAIGLMIQLGERITLKEIWLKISLIIVVLLFIGLFLNISDKYLGLHIISLSNNMKIFFSWPAGIMFIMLGTFDFFGFVGLKSDRAEARENGHPTKSLFRTFIDWTDEPVSEEEAKYLKDIYSNPFGPFGPFRGL